MCFLVLEPLQLFAQLKTFQWHGYRETLSDEQRQKKLSIPRSREHHDHRARWQLFQQLISHAFSPRESIRFRHRVQRSFVGSHDLIRAQQSMFCRQNEPRIRISFSVAPQPAEQW